MASSKATAIAHPNIAFVKYWGKRDDKLKLPTTSSLSMTLDNFFTKTTVEFSDDYSEDSFNLNGKSITGGNMVEKVAFQLETIRKYAGIKDKYAKVMSTNNFPEASGIASSSSAFSALTVAVCKALNLDIDKREMSILARQGSGSACRSIFDGIVEWKKGVKEDGTDSYAEQAFDKDYWQELKMIILIVDAKEKHVKSTNGMKITKETSPFYEEWIKANEIDLKNIKQAINQKNFSSLGSMMEMNCLRMHSIMISSNPPLVYWKPETLMMIEKIRQLRENSLECYFTIDAGANIMILCIEKDVEKIIQSFENMNFIHDFVVCSAGEGARLIEEHLF